MKTFTNSFRASRLFFAALSILFSTLLTTGAALRNLQNRYATISIDGRGFITSLVSRGSGKEYCPAGHPSPLLSLHESDQPNDRLLQPISAAVRGEKDEIELKYPNGAKAVVKAAAKEDYFRFQLVSLDPRGRSEKETVDNIVWGPLNTTVSKHHRRSHRRRPRRRLGHRHDRAGRQHDRRPGGRRRLLRHGLLHPLARSGEISRCRRNTRKASGSTSAATESTTSPSTRIRRNTSSRSSAPARSWSRSSAPRWPITPAIAANRTRISSRCCPAFSDPGRGIR